MIKLKDLLMEGNVVDTAGIILRCEIAGIILVKEEEWWGIPKGKVDPGETPIYAACRETLEEVSVLVSVKGSHINEPISLLTKKKNSRGGDFYIYESKLKMAVVPIKSHEHEEVRYFTKFELPDNIDPRIKELL
tara:strand:- start:704 stop:1105 length:402 start_codon:yes stop_codon:yes gene_type:complete